MGGHGTVSPGVILVPLVQKTPGLMQLFSLISSSHSGPGNPEASWEGKGYGGGLEKPVREREWKTKWRETIAFLIGEPLPSRWNLHPHRLQI